MLLFLNGETEICNIANQECKESNRITIIYDILKRCNVDITKFENGNLLIKGNKFNFIEKDIYINCMNDHRIAMSSSLLVSKVENLFID